MAPPQAINHHVVLPQHPAGAANPNTNPETNTEHPTSTTSQSTPILRRVNPPTTHDPTTRPPWKQLHFHERPPTSDWAVLWPRPATYYCPPGASRLTNWAGCHYVDPPKAFDPEIEGLPDWMGAKGEKEGRLWSGADRVVEVPGEKKMASLEDEWKGLRKRGEDGEKEEWVEEGGLVDLDDGKGEEGEGDIEKGERVLNTVPHIPTGAERTSSSSWTSIQTPTPMLPTTTSSPAPAPTSTALPTATVSPLAQRNDWHLSIGPAVFFTTITISFLIVLTWLAFWAKKFWNKLAKRSNERYQEESRRRCQEIVARQAGIELKDVNVEEGRAENPAEANVQEERWQDVALR